MDFEEEFKNRRIQ